MLAKLLYASQKKSDNIYVGIVFISGNCRFIYISDRIGKENKSP